VNKKTKHILEAAYKRGMKPTKWERVDPVEDKNEHRKKLGLKPLKKEKP